MTTPKPKAAPATKNSKPLILRLISAALRVGGVLAPGYTANTVRRLLFTSQRGRVRPNEAQVLQEATVSRQTLDGEQVYHYVWGSGDKRAVLVHGWSGHAGQMTSFVKPLVDAGWQVIALDLPAHGRSSGKTASIIHFKKALKQAEQVHGHFHGVVAHSLGAASIALALLKGEVFERAVFFGPVTRFDFIWQQSMDLLGISRKLMDRAVLNAEKWLDIRFPDITPENYAPRLATPLLVVHDKNDYEVPLDCGQKLAAAWPGAQLMVTEKLGHVKVLHDPGAIARTVSFLDER